MTPMYETSTLLRFGFRPRRATDAAFYPVPRHWTAHRFSGGRRCEVRPGSREGKMRRIFGTFAGGN